MFFSNSILTTDSNGRNGEKRSLRISISVLNHGDEVPRVMGIMHDVSDLQREVTRQSASLADAERALSDCVKRLF